MLMVVGLNSRLDAQEIMRTIAPIDYMISPPHLLKNSAGRKILASLALNNGLSLTQVKIRLQANVFIRIQRDSIRQHLLEVKILTKHLSGKTFFRDFAIDSLLIPVSVNGLIELHQGDDTLLRYKVNLLTSGAPALIELPADLQITPDSIGAEFQIDGVYYNEYSKLLFDRYAGLINFYYAYNEILEELIAGSDAVSLNKKEGATAVFIAWHEISRVNNYIAQHGFVEKLHLEKKDPAGLYNRYATAKRMEKRAATLSRQILKADKRGKLSDKKKYGAAYAQLSQQYLDRAHHLQPYLASGFEEVAQIFPSDEEKNRLAEVAAYYDVFNRLGDANTPQLIYSNFIDLAQHAFDKNQFVVSLQLLKNASQIEEWFHEVSVSESFYGLYNQSLDGVMTSYLKVSINAYKIGKFEMADKYFDKAQMIFEEFGRAYSENETDDSFLSFTEQQIELSRDLIADGEYQKAFTLLNQAQDIRHCKAVHQDCRQIDTLIAAALRGMFDQKMDVVSDWIFQEEFDSALCYLHVSKAFIDRYADYFEPFPAEDFVIPATILFETFYDRGKDILKSRQPEKALAYLLKAQEVERDYLGQQNSRLKILVYNATIPAILKEIEKAGFETWANRMHNADSIYVRAKHLQRQYQQENSEELKIAFFELEAKMEQRICVDLNYRVQNLNALIVNRVRSGKIDLAAGFLQEANSIIENHPNCNIDGAETKKLEQKYIALFTYRQFLKKTDASVRDGKYDSAIVQFNSLTQYFSQHQLERFGVEAPSLYDFVDAAGLPGLTSEAAWYFTQTEDFMEALRYLDLLKKQGVSSWESKKLQQLVGRGIAYSESTDEQVLAYTQGDAWYFYFKLARLTKKVRK
jgi:hypothetical protein